MGLADFMVQAGRGTSAANIGAAFGGNGGKTIGQAFIDNELPMLADQIHKAQTKDDLVKAGQALIASGLKAGMRPEGLQRVMEMTVAPALQNLQSGEIDKLRQDYGAQPAQPRPQGTEGPLTEGGNFIDPKQEKPLDLNFAMRLGQATGANPEQFRQMLGTPADIAGKQLSNQKTQSAIDAEQAKESAIKGLSNEPLAPGQPSMQAVARLNPGGLAQFMPQREDTLQDKRGEVMDAQIRNLNHLADRPYPPAGNTVSPYQQFNEEARLRNEFQAQSKNFQQVRDSFNRIQTSAQSPTPAGDLSMLYNYMKMLDPGSVVRESEFRSAATAKPLLERLGLSFDAVSSLWSGQKMTPGMRQDFLNRANQLYSAEAQQHGKRVNEYKRLATGQGLNPANVITDMEATGEAPATSAQAPAQGQQLDAQTAAQILKDAGGDKNKAREIAKQRGFRF